jgi:hypothetical protein
MVKRRSGGQELGELVSTARTGSVAQFDFHQSDKSNVLPLVSFLSSNDLMESVVPHEFGFHHLRGSVCTRISGCP